jgi:hypothetical protein
MSGHVMWDLWGGECFLPVLRSPLPVLTALTAPIILIMKALLITKTKLEQDNATRI